MNVEKYYNEKGELAVLYSPGWGAGWSTWNDEALGYDKRIVEYWLNESPSSEEMKKFLKSLGYKETYMGGYSSLTIDWIPRGTMFYVDEYDGSESIRTPDSCGMITA